MLTALNHFDRPTARTYLCTLIACCYADGDIGDDERLFIQQRAATLDMDLTPLWSSAPLLFDAIVPAPIPPKDRLYILRDCILLMAIDGRFDNREHDVISKAAIALDVSPFVLAQLEAWVMELIRCQQKGDLLIERLS